MDHLSEKIDIIHIQRNNFADSHTGTVKDLEDRLVPCTEPRISRRCIQKPLNIRQVKKLRKFLVLLRSLDSYDGIRFDVIALHKKLVETSQGRDLTSRSRFRVLLFEQLRHIRPYRIYIGSKN